MKNSCDIDASIIRNISGTCNFFFQIKMAFSDRRGDVIKQGFKSHGSSEREG